MTKKTRTYHSSRDKDEAMLDDVEFTALVTIVAAVFWVGRAPARDAETQEDVIDRAVAFVESVEMQIEEMQEGET